MAALNGTSTEPSTPVVSWMPWFWAGSRAVSSTAATRDGVGYMVGARDSRQPDGALQAPTGYSLCHGDDADRMRRGIVAGLVLAVAGLVWWLLSGSFEPA